MSTETIALLTIQLIVLAFVLHVWRLIRRMDSFTRPVKPYRRGFWARVWGR